MILRAFSPRVSDINEQKLRPIPQCASAKVAVALLRCKATPGLDDIADPDLTHGCPLQHWIP